MSRLQFLIEKRCPYCGFRLNSVALLLIRPLDSEQCDNCLLFYGISQFNLFLSVLLPIIFLIVLGYIFSVDFEVIVILILLAIFVFPILFAKPIEFKSSK